MRLPLALTPLLIAGCASTPAPRSPGLQSDCARRICFHAKLLETKVPRLRVRLTIPDAALPAGTSTHADTLQYPFWAESFRQASGYVDFVHQDSADFTESSTRTEGMRTLNYDVTLDHASKGPRHGLDEVPHRTSKGWLLVGRAFIPILKIAGTLQPHLPAELHLDTGKLPLTTLAGEPVPGARVGTIADLAHALYYVGPHASLRVEHGATTVHVLSASFTEQQLQPLATLVKNTLAQAEHVLGPAPKRSRLLIYDSQPLGFAGGVIGDDITLMSSTPPDASGLSAMGAVVVHELSHLWLKADAPWLSEGFNTYLELVLGLQLDAASPKRTARALLRLHSKFQAHAQTAEPLAKAKGLRAYSAGAVAAFCLDTRLRTHGSSVLKTLRSALNGDGEGTTVQRYFDSVQAVSPTDAQYLRQLIHQEEPIDLQACLREAGFRLTNEPYEGYTLRALVVDVLKITGFSPQRAEIFRTKPDSIFEVGDVIVSVDGAAIELIPQIDLLVAKSKPGSKLPVVVQRKGVTTTLQLQVPTLGPKARQSHQDLQLQYSPDAAAALLTP